MEKTYAHGAIHKCHALRGEGGSAKRCEFAKISVSGYILGSNSEISNV